MTRHYAKYFIAVIAIKMLLAYLVPITSDEAYWYALGQELYTNYYDHPPMICWIVYLFSSVGAHLFFVRLFPVLCSVIVAFGILWYIKRVYNDEDKAKLVSLAFLFAPLNILFVPIASDSALGLFVFLSGAAFCYGMYRDRCVPIFLSGIFLGLAVLSKYFSGLLLIAMIVCLMVNPNKKRSIRSFLVLLAGAMPFVLVHLYWNYNSCWTNYMFNVINRSSDTNFSFKQFLNFIAFQFYLAMPWCLYYLSKHFETLKNDIRSRTNNLFWLFGVPILIFGIVSFKETGLHWFIAFYPFFFMLLVYVADEKLVKMNKMTMLFSAIHVVLILVILMLPLRMFKKYEYYHDIVLSMHGDELVEKIKTKYGSNYKLATNGYYTSGVLTYFSGQNTIVFHDDSSFGRQDDKVTDFRLLEGENILILSTLAIKDDYSIYFDTVEYDTITIQDNVFNIVLGNGFKFNIYKEKFLRKVLKKFYAIPDYLPVGDCFFYNKYFPDHN